MHQPALAGTGLADDADQFAVAAGGIPHGFERRRQLGVAVDEAREPARRGHFPTGARRGVAEISNSSSGSRNPFTGTAPRGLVAISPSASLTTCEVQ